MDEYAGLSPLSILITALPAASLVMPFPTTWSFVDGDVVPIPTCPTLETYKSPASEATPFIITPPSESEL